MFSRKAHIDHVNDMLTEVGSTVLDVCCNSFDAMRMIQLSVKRLSLPNILSELLCALSDGSIPGDLE